MKLVVFDLGGSAVKYGLYENETLRHTDKFPTPTTMEALMAEMKKVVDHFQPGVTGVAMSAPGAVNVKKRCIEGISAIEYIHNRPIYDELEAYLGLPVTIENDANCAGICEMRIGAGVSFSEAVFVVLGTGVGGTVFINNQIYRGAHLFGGEFGLMKGKKGKILSRIGSGVKAALRYSEESGEKVDGKELFARSEKGDALAQKVLSDMYDDIAEMIYNVQVSIDPEIVILGGGISARKELPVEIASRVEKMLTEELVPEIMPKIVPCQYQNDANLLGAALTFVDLKGK